MKCRSASFNPERGYYKYDVISYAREYRIIKLVALTNKLNKSKVHVIPSEPRRKQNVVTQIGAGKKRYGIGR